MELLYIYIHHIFRIQDWQKSTHQLAKPQNKMECLIGLIITWMDENTLKCINVSKRTNPIE